MALAAEGLPAAGGGGYELLDSLSGFGTTSQMFDAAYWRAKEGEIARTLLAMPEVKAARVHIASAPTRAFQPEAKPTASVTLTTVSGALTEAQAKRDPASGGQRRGGDDTGGGADHRHGCRSDRRPGSAGI